jgi:hypothetical protein
MRYFWQSMLCFTLGLKACVYTTYTQNIIGCTILLPTSTLIFFIFTLIAILNFFLILVELLFNLLAECVFFFTKDAAFYVCVYYVGVSTVSSTYFVGFCRVHQFCDYGARYF